MKCTKCGVRNKEDAEFCEECGASIKGKHDIPNHSSKSLVWLFTVIGIVLFYIIIKNKNKILKKN